MGNATKGRRLGITIRQDPDAENPRSEDYDNLGTMYCAHRRYDLGDVQMRSQADISEQERATEGDIKLPLYLYDHGGRRVSTEPFRGRAQHAEWDSMRLGFISVSRERVRECYGVKRVTAKVAERAQATLRAEVENYDCYLSGDVWEYEVVEYNQDGEVLGILDACASWYGLDNCKAAALASARDFQPDFTGEAEVSL